MKHLKPTVDVLKNKISLEWEVVLAYAHTFGDTRLPAGYVIKTYRLKETAMSFVAQTGCDLRKAERDF